MAARAPTDGPEAPATTVEVLSQQPDRFADLVASPQAGLEETCSRVPGLRSGRFYRSTDGKSAMLISEFATQEDFERFLGSMLLLSHHHGMAPQPQGSEPDSYGLAYDAEDEP
ncbi:MAG TPA: hypothetical protein VGL55_14505 [Steroidobacteraceae bacterium]|jgi:heme-degrading monooxygenase HmoA